VLRTFGHVIACLTCAAVSAAAQNRVSPDSDLTRSVGHWVASGVSFQSGDGTHPFAVEVRRVGEQLQATLPVELNWPAGMYTSWRGQAPVCFAMLMGRVGSSSSLSPGRIARRC